VRIGSQPAQRRTAPEPVRGVTKLFESDYEQLVRLAYNLVLNTADAEEVVQEAFVDLHRRWATILNPAGYVRTSVVNGARSVIRRREQGARTSGALADDGTAGGDDEYLLDIVDQLPERQRAAVVLAYYGQWTASEIGEALGCGRNTAKSLVRRGVKTIAKEIAT